MCNATLGDSRGLVCDNPNPHEPHRGCTYTASSQPDEGHDNKDSLARNESER